MVGRLRTVLLLAVLGAAAAAFAEPAVEAERAAAVDVERTSQPAGIDAALAKLGEAEWIDRLTGVYALQRMAGAAAPAAPALVAALGDDNGLVRVEAAESLTRIGAAAVPALRPAVADPREQVRLLAVQTLGRIGLPASPALPDLRLSATEDASPEVRDAAAFALSVVEPHGIGGWVRKIGFEIGDEPWGVPSLLVVFVALSTLVAVVRMLRARRRARPPGAPSAAAQAPGASAPPADAGEEDDAADDDADEDTDEGEDTDEDAASTGSSRARASGDRDHRPAPPQGLPHAVAGLIAMSVGGLVLFLGTLKDGDPDERHGVYHFAALFLLFGYLFAKIGLKGAWTERRARARVAAAGEAWLRDRAWSRDGTGPIKAERVLPNLIALLLWAAFLTPFHTVWRLPFAYWGAWIVLGIFDAIGVAILVATARRAWWRLRGGRCFLRWQGVPVRPGGTLTARFETAHRLAGGAPLTATLRCLRDRSENRVIGDEPAADAEEIYADAKSFALHDRPEGGSWAQLSFAVPATARGTNSYAMRPVRWVVTVALPIAGPDFRTTFPVPIYR